MPTSTTASVNVVGWVAYALLQPLRDRMRLTLTSVTPADVLAVVADLYPQGVVGIEQAEVIRAVFLRLKRHAPAGG
jgi:hypothetical protein